MENKTNPAPEKKSSGSNKIWIILFALSGIFNVYQWQNKNTVVESYEFKTDSLMTAKMDVDKELGETYQELNQYKGINDKLDSLLAEANTTIDQQKARIEKMLKNEKNSAALNKKLKAELEEVKKLRDEYLEKIDKLLVENEQLKKDDLMAVARVTIDECNHRLLVRALCKRHTPAGLRRLCRMCMPSTST